MSNGDGGRSERAPGAGAVTGAEGGETLTRTEREVARLVGEGLTNREIAEERFVSVRTVETHVSHILDKLGIPSRRQLAREARSLGL